MERGSSSRTVEECFYDWGRVSKEDSFISFNPRKWYLALRNAKIVTVEPVIFLYMFAAYLFLSLSQGYYFNRYALDVLVNASDVNSLEENGSACVNRSDLDVGSNVSLTMVESKSTSLTAYTSLSRRIPSIITTLILGPLSDSFGRRPVFILVAAGGILQGVCTICIVYFDLNLYYFILATSLSGISGDFSSLMMGSFSYVSDVSSNKWRTLRLGIAESMVFFAGMISSGAGGVWFDMLNCELIFPLLLFTACNLGIILYVVFLLPESLTSQQRLTKNSGKPRGLQMLVRGLQILFCHVTRYVSSVGKMWLAIIPLFIIVINLTGQTSLSVFFLKTLNWTSALIGVQLSIVMASRLFSLVVVLPVLTAFQLPDIIICLIGAPFNCVMNILTGLSDQIYQIFISKLENEIYNDSDIKLV